MSKLLSGITTIDPDAVKTNSMNQQTQWQMDDFINLLENERLAHEETKIQLAESHHKLDLFKEATISEFNILQAQFKTRTEQLNAQIQTNAEQAARLLTLNAQYKEQIMMKDKEIEDLITELNETRADRDRVSITLQQKVEKLESLEEMLDMNPHQVNRSNELVNKVTRIPTQLFSFKILKEEMHKQKEYQTKLDRMSVISEVSHANPGQRDELDIEVSVLQQELEKCEVGQVFKKSPPTTPHRVQTAMDFNDLTCKNILRQETLSQSISQEDSVCHLTILQNPTLSGHNRSVLFLELLIFHFSMQTTDSTATETKHKEFRWTDTEKTALCEAVKIYGTSFNHVCSWGIKNGQFIKTRTPDACRRMWGRLSKRQ